MARDAYLVLAYCFAGAAIALFLWSKPSLLRRTTPTEPAKSLEIREIYIYPIKSLRPTRVDSALATRHGFEHDRVFMLLRVTPQGHDNMAVSRYPEMTQFLTSIHAGKHGEGILHVHYRAFGNPEKATSTRIPLRPDTKELAPFHVDMHQSSTAAFRMPKECNTWFSDCFGYDVILVYLGDNKRKVLWQDMVHTVSTSLLARLPLLNLLMPQTPEITFADCAPYLIVSSASLDDVSSRVRSDGPMDVTKFRPNIVVSGADEAWEEDYWHKLRIGRAELVMKHNCVRCASLNIDYETGKPGTGESGKVLQKLQKDRRVDKGARWSPVFGRYAFWNGGHSHQVFNRGDKAVVTDIIKERTIFNWPGIG